MYVKNYSIDENYYDLMQEVITEHEDLDFINTSDVRIDVIASQVKKKRNGGDVYGECLLVKDIYKLYCPYDFLIILYEQNIEDLSLDQLKILMYHELLHVGIDEKNGEPIYNIRPHDIEDFSTIIERYGIDWANG